MKPPNEPHDLLPAYVAGSLDSEKSARFRAHLDSCVVCRGDLAFMTAVKSGAGRHGADYFADHPEVDAIVALATGEEVGEVDESVRRHLDICASCVAEVSWVRGEADLRASTGRPAAVRSMNGRWGWLTAAAALLALATVVGLRSGREALEFSAGAVSTGFVQPAERGDEAGNVIVVNPNSKAVILTIVVDLPRTAFPTTLELLDDAGNPVLSYSVNSPADLEEEAYSSLTCGVNLCTSGSYSVRIAAGTSDEHRLPLKLVSAPN